MYCEKYHVNMNERLRFSNSEPSCHLVYFWSILLDHHTFATIYLKAIKNLIDLFITCDNFDNHQLVLNPKLNNYYVEV
jgi:hypothetical protein